LITYIHAEVLGVFDIVAITHDVIAIIVVDFFHDCLWGFDADGYGHIVMSEQFSVRLNV